MSMPITTKPTAILEIVDYIEDPVMRDQYRIYQGLWPHRHRLRRPGSYQNLGGRLTSPSRRAQGKTPTSPHRDINTLIKRWMDAIGIDIACMFPTPMLQLGTCPRIDVETAIARAYNRCFASASSRNELLRSLDASSRRSAIPKPKLPGWSRSSATRKA